MNHPSPDLMLYRNEGRYITRGDGKSSLYYVYEHEGCITNMIGRPRTLPEALRMIGIEPKHPVKLGD